MAFARFQRYWAWGSLVGFAGAAAVALTACLGTRFGFYDYATGIHILEAGVGIGALALICGTVWIVRALKANDGTASRIGLAGLIGALIVVGIPGHYAWQKHTQPPIHDVSTDLGNAPVFRKLKALRAGAQTPAEYEGQRIVRSGGERMTAAVAQKYAYPRIKPVECLAGRIPQNEFVEKYFWRALNAVNALDWHTVDFDLKAGAIEATTESFWFGVTSDIVIRVRPAGSIGVRVDIRAKSRVRGSDMGHDAHLVKDFMSIVRCR